MMNILKLIGKHKILFTICLGVVLAGGYYFFNYSKGDDNSSQKSEIEKVEKGDIEIVVNGSGQIQAESQVDLKPQVAGDGLDIINILVENNQLVKEGDIIAILDSGDAEEKIRDARLSLLTVQIQYDEVAREFDNKTSEEIWKRDLAQNTVNQRANELNDAYKDLEDYKIKAPFDGIVTGLDFEAGDSISRNEILASVITEKMQAEISLNEIDAVKIEKGDPAVLVFDVLGEETIKGEVSRVDTIGQVSSGVVSYDVVISFETLSELLKPGMSVEADIEIESVENVLIISSAIVKEDQKGNEYVLVVDVDYSFDSDVSKPEKRIVETGITDDVNVEIKNGLVEGEMITTGQILVDSSQSKIKNTNSNSLIPMGGPGGGGGRK